MSEHYTPKQAMERLHILSMNGFIHLTKELPEIFVNVNQNTNRDKNPWYGKDTVDKFARPREYYTWRSHEHSNYHKYDLISSETTP